MASIIKRGKKYRALVRKRGISRCRTFETKTAARTWSTRIEAEIDAASAGAKLPVRGWTIGRVIDEYTAVVKPNKNWSDNKDCSLNIVKRHIGERAVSTYSTALVLSFVNERRKSGVGTSAINSGLSYLNAAMRFGRNTLRLDVPLDAVSEARSVLADNGALPPVQSRERRPTAEELGKLADYFAVSNSKISMQDLVEFAIASSMRRAEICRIEWADLDTEKRTVVIRKRKHPTKKASNDQVVPLLGDAFSIAVRQPRIDSRIFPFNIQTISANFLRACRITGINDLRFHDLRHEALSRLFEQGYEIQEVAVVSGHSSWDMLKRYTHIKPESLHREVRP